MRKGYKEDDGSEFPINNLVDCGQMPLRIDFAGATVEELSGRSASAASRTSNGLKFTTKVSIPRR